WTGEKCSVVFWRRKVTIYGPHSKSFWGNKEWPRRKPSPAIGLPAMKRDTLFVRAGHRVDPETGAISPPLHFSTTFARNERNELVGPSQYIREGNPTQTLFEDALAPLEEGDVALAFSSGMAAASAVLQTLVSGDHLILPDDVYYGVRVAAFDFLRPWGIRADLAAMDDPAALRAAIRPETRLLWLETPSNPLMKITDLAEAIATAREGGAL